MRALAETVSIAANGMWAARIWISAIAPYVSGL